MVDKANTARSISELLFSIQGKTVGDQNEGAVPSAEVEMKEKAEEAAEGLIADVQCVIPDSLSEAVRDDQAAPLLGAELGSAPYRVNEEEFSARLQSDLSAEDDIKPILADILPRVDALFAEAGAGCEAATELERQPPDGSREPYQVTMKQESGGECLDTLSAPPTTGDSEANGSSATVRNKRNRRPCHSLLSGDFVDPTLRTATKRISSRSPVPESPGLLGEYYKGKSYVGSPNSGPPLRYPIGSLVWARISGHPWWPCMICTDVDGSNEYTRITGSKQSRRSSFVEFFGPTVEHAWIADNSLIEYKGMEEFKSYAQRKVDEAPKKLLKEKLVERFQLKVALSKRTAWEDAVKEADQMLGCSIPERLHWRANNLDRIRKDVKASPEKSASHVESPEPLKQLSAPLAACTSSETLEPAKSMVTPCQGAPATTAPCQRPPAPSVKAAVALSRRSQRIISRKSSSSTSHAPGSLAVKRLAKCPFCGTAFQREQGPRDVGCHLLRCDAMKGKRMSRCPFCSKSFAKPKMSPHKLKCHVQACSKRAFVKPNQREETAVFENVETSTNKSVDTLPGEETRAGDVTSARRQLRSSRHPRQASPTRPNGRVVGQSDIRPSQSGQSLVESSEMGSQSELAKTRNRDRGKAAGGRKNAEPCKTVTVSENDEERQCKVPLLASNKPRMRLIRRPQLQSFLPSSSEDRTQADPGRSSALKDDLAAMLTAHQSDNSSSTGGLRAPMGDDLKPDVVGLRAGFTRPPSGTEDRLAEDRRCRALEALAKSCCSRGSIASRLGVAVDVITRDFYGDFGSISHDGVMLGRLDLACCVIAEGTRASLAAIRHRVPYKYLLMVIRGRSQEHAIEEFKKDFEVWKASGHDRLKRQPCDASDSENADGQHCPESKRQRVDSSAQNNDQTEDLTADPAEVDGRASSASAEDDEGCLVRCDTLECVPVKCEHDYAASDRRCPQDLRYRMPRHPPYASRTSWIGAYTTPHSESLRMLNTSRTYSRGFSAQDATGGEGSAMETAAAMSPEDESNIVKELMAMQDKLWACQYAINAAGSVVQDHEPSERHDNRHCGREWWHYLLLKYPCLRKAIVTYFCQYRNETAEQGSPIGHLQTSAGNCPPAKKRSAA